MRKQRLFLLLSVTILLLAGCGGKENQVTEEQNVETETQTVLEALEDISEEKETETVTEQPEETQESTEPEESATAEDDKEKDNSSEGQTSSATEKEQDSQNQSNAQNEPSKPQTTEPDTKPEPEPEAPQEPQIPQEPQEPQEPQQPSQPEPVSYSPQRVVQLATEKTKAAGKIYIPDDLDRMLAEGTITQEDYNDCYPTDGAGYLEFYVATDLNEARDVSGTVKFNSEDDIAANIAGMYSSLPQQYFYIEYHGTVMYGDKECYVFYCYRA